VKVYLAWNDGDVYGPDPVDKFVYTTLEAAKKACEEDPYCRKGGGWTAAGNGRWNYSADNYYIQEVEPAS
jgi:hypothetical protein